MTCAHGRSSAASERGTHRTGRPRRQSRYRGPDRRRSRHNPRRAALDGRQTQRRSARTGARRLDKTRKDGVRGRTPVCLAARLKAKRTCGWSFQGRSSFAIVGAASWSSWLLLGRRAGSRLSVSNSREVLCYDLIPTASRTDRCPGSGCD